MSIEPGRTLAHYRIVEKIGEGGMGVVWKAVDTNLGREAAIKVLPEAFAGEEERLARFEREARLLASLNHPSIAAVYGLHEAGGVRFIAMELVEGEDLQQRLEHGPLPLDEALATARRVAEALEAAHEHGVIHRDLKPANVVLAADGSVKVLDFGLAKALAPDPGSGSAAGPSMSPTITSAGTAAGVILGTAAYMAPEQARGKPVDRRADIWAFGCLLYEMLTGRRLFDGETVSDALAAVLRAEIDLSPLPAATPVAVRRMIVRCLDRDPLTRLRDAGEARILLSAPGQAQPEAEPAAATRLRPLWIAGAAVLALAVGIAIGRSLVAPPEAPPPAVTFDLTVPDARIESGSIALSPDGTRLVFLIRGHNGDPEIWLRSLDAVEARRIPGTAGASFPFWSPDGRELGFFASGQLMRISLDGAAPRPIAHAPEALGGSWGADGVILFGSAGGPIFRASAAGGSAPVAVTRVEEGVENAHVWPVFLPDGKRFVFLSDASSDEGHRVWLASLDGDPPRILLKVIRSSLALDPAGYLLLVQQNQLVAYPFDLGRGSLAGESVLVADGIYPLGTQHHAPFSVSANGILAYQKGSDVADLLRIGFDGAVAARLAEPDRFGNPAVSPDGRRVAFEIHGSQEEQLVWVHDVERGVRTPVSQRGARADSAAWSADGETVYFDANPSGDWEVYRKRADGGGDPERLGRPTQGDAGVLDCSPDGRWLLVSGDPGGGKFDLFLLPLDGNETEAAEWIPWAASAADESYGSFSPDSRWIAYVSDASGRPEVYVASVDGGPAARRWQVSAGGGLEPHFSPDGHRIYFRSPAGSVMSATVTVSGGGSRIEAGVPEFAFELLIPDVPFVRNMFDVTPDGKGLVTLRGMGNDDTSIRVVTRWR